MEVRKIASEASDGIFLDKVGKWHHTIAYVRHINLFKDVFPRDVPKLAKVNHCIASGRNWWNMLWMVRKMNEWLQLNKQTAQQGGTGRYTMPSRSWVGRAAEVWWQTPSACQCVGMIYHEAVCGRWNQMLHLSALGICSAEPLSSFYYLIRLSWCFRWFVIVLEDHFQSILNQRAFGIHQRWLNILWKDVFWQWALCRPLLALLQDSSKSPLYYLLKGLLISCPGVSKTAWDCSPSCRRICERTISEHPIPKVTVVMTCLHHIVCDRSDRFYSVRPLLALSHSSGLEVLLRFFYFS